MRGGEQRGEESSEGRKGRVYKVVWKLEEQNFSLMEKKKTLVFIATENIHIHRCHNYTAEPPIMDTLRSRQPL